MRSRTSTSEISSGRNRKKLNPQLLQGLVCLGLHFADLRLVLRTGTPSLYAASTPEITRALLPRYHNSAPFPPLHRAWP